MAALVTIADAVLAFPIAYYMARVASPRARNLLVVAVLMPLWASYLVKAYAWRTILSGAGVLNWALGPLGLSFNGYSSAGLWLVFTYLWLPFMILPVYAGLERIPSSLLEASADLGGKSLRTFFRVTLPLAFPAVVAGSIFTFSLTLGDYIAPKLITSQQFIGTLIYDNHGTNLPVAAAFTLVPIVVMIVYLVVARQAITLVLILPLALPGIISGRALRTSYETFGVSFGLLTIIIGHATFCIVVVYNNAQARLRRVAGSLEQASADLGPDSWQTFRFVTFPQMRTALLAGALLAFALSWDEVVVTIFTAGAQQTLPIWLFANLFRPVAQPVVNAVALFVIVLPLIPVGLAQRLTAERTGGLPGADAR